MQMCTCRADFEECCVARTYIRGARHKLCLEGVSALQLLVLLVLLQLLFLQRC
jgi:hypothetical protein